MISSVIPSNIPLDLRHSFLECIEELHKVKTVIQAKKRQALNSEDTVKSKALLQNQIYNIKNSILPSLREGLERLEDAVAEKTTFHTNRLQAIRDNISLIRRVVNIAEDRPIEKDPIAYHNRNFRMCIADKLHIRYVRSGHIWFYTTSHGTRFYYRGSGCTDPVAVSGSEWQAFGYNSFYRFDPFGMDEFRVWVRGEWSNGVSFWEQTPDIDVREDTTYEFRKISRLSQSRTETEWVPDPYGEPGDDFYPLERTVHVSPSVTLSVILDVYPIRY